MLPMPLDTPPPSARPWPTTQPGVETRAEMPDALVVGATRVSGADFGTAFREAMRDIQPEELGNEAGPVMSDTPMATCKDDLIAARSEAPDQSAGMGESPEVTEEEHRWYGIEPLDDIALPELVEKNIGTPEILRGLNILSPEPDEEGVGDPSIVSIQRSGPDNALQMTTGPRLGGPMVLQHFLEAVLFQADAEAAPPKNPALREADCGYRTSEPRLAGDESASPALPEVSRAQDGIPNVSPMAMPLLPRSKSPEVISSVLREARPDGQKSQEGSEQEMADSGVLAKDEIASGEFPARWRPDPGHVRPADESPAPVRRVNSDGDNAYPRKAFEETEAISAGPRALLAWDAARERKANPDRPPSGRQRVHTAHQQVAARKLGEESEARGRSTPSGKPRSDARSIQPASESQSLSVAVGASASAPGVMLSNVSLPVIQHGKGSAHRSSGAEPRSAELQEKIMARSVSAVRAPSEPSASTGPDVERRARPWEQRPSPELPATVTAVIEPEDRDSESVQPEARRLRGTAAPAPSISETLQSESDVRPADVRSRDRRPVTPRASGKLPARLGTDRQSEAGFPVAVRPDRTETGGSMSADGRGSSAPEWRALGWGKAGGRDPELAEGHSRGDPADVNKQIFLRKEPGKAHVSAVEMRSTRLHPPSNAAPPQPLPDMSVRDAGQSKSSVAKPETRAVVEAVNGLLSEPKPLRSRDSDEPLSEALLPRAPASVLPARDSGPVPRNVPMSPLRQVAEAIVAGAEGEVDIRLEPEELGRVRFHIQLTDHGVALHVSADRPETLEMLRRNVDQLARYLSESDIQSSNFSFSGERRGRPAAAPSTKGPGAQATSERVSGGRSDAVAHWRISPKGMDLRL
ncbi:flagellar hook-length control protein FliK [Salipiger sp. H15]|uniref:Flagellar hook-length control protein FliK n=1 Tax=Alloyangia sp. H15 TaxID=3029062 RepID=A0AAU8AJ21_9RHOB